MLTTETPIAEIRYNLERGRVRNSSGKQEQALPFFHKAYDLGVLAHDMDLTIDATHMLGIAAMSPDECMQWDQIGLALVDANPNMFNWSGPPEL